MCEKIVDARIIIAYDSYYYGYLPLRALNAWSVAVALTDKSDQEKIKEEPKVVGVVHSPRSGHCSPVPRCCVNEFRTRFSAKPGD